MESFLENTGELGEFRLEKIDERPPLNFKKQEKHVYRVYGKLDEAGTSSINPLEVGQELGLFDARASRGKDFLEKTEIVKCDEVILSFFGISMAAGNMLISFLLSIILIITIKQEFSKWTKNFMSKW